MKMRNRVAREQLLFHGTRATKPEKIYTSPNGFDVGYARAGRWGKATYFAENASYSDNFAHVIREYDIIRKHEVKRKQMFLAKVLTGTCYHNAAPDSSRTRPPFRQHREGGDMCHYMYDSVSGVTCDRSRVYAIFDNFHSYPNYLITYVYRYF